MSTESLRANIFKLKCFTLLSRNKSVYVKYKTSTFFTKPKIFRERVFTFVFVAICSIFNDNTVFYSKTPGIWFYLALKSRNTESLSESGINRKVKLCA